MCEICEKLQNDDYVTISTLASIFTGGSPENVLQSENVCEEFKTLVASYIFFQASIGRKDYRENWLQKIPQKYHAEYDFPAFKKIQDRIRNGRS